MVHDLTEEEMQEIEVHRYYLSEKVGYDVGTHFAACDWIKNYARQWRDWKKEQYKKSKSCHSNQSK